MQPTYANTLQRTTSIVTPLAKSTPVTQSSQMPTISAAFPHIGDILEPASSEQARSVYLERQMRQMDNVKLPSGMPSLEDGMTSMPESLHNRIQNLCQEKKDKRKQEWESHKTALEKLKESKRQQHHQQTKKREMPCMLRCYRILRGLELL